MRMRNFTSVVRGTCHVFEKFSCLTLTGVSFNLDAENNYGNLSSILKMPSACWFKTLFFTFNSDRTGYVDSVRERMPPQ